MEDTLFAVLFCGACMFCLDHLGIWKDVILKTVGADLYTHHFVITYVVNNAAFFPFAFFLARYDLRNYKGKVQKSHRLLIEDYSLTRRHFSLANCIR